MKFNKFVRSLMVAALLMSAAAVSVQAQTSTNAAPSAQSFFTSAEQYLTSFNTNYSWTGVSFEADSGYKQVTGVGAASVLDFQYDPTFAGQNRFHIASSFQFSGVGSAFNAEEAGVGYDLIEHYDTVLAASLLGGYDENVHSAMVDPGLYVEKLMTENTFTKIGISLPFYMREKFNATPTFTVAAGFKF